MSTDEQGPAPLSVEKVFVPRSTTIRGPVEFHVPDHTKLVITAAPIAEWREDR